MGPVIVFSSSLFLRDMAAALLSDAKLLAQMGRILGDRRRKASLLVMLGIAIACASAWGDNPDHVIERNRSSMGTNVHIMIWGWDETAAVKAMEIAFAEIDRLDLLMSPWKPESDVSHLNAAAGDGKWVSVSPETIEVLDKAAEASKLSEGAFDITVGSFAGLWKFDAQDKDGSVPSKEDIEERKKLVNWKDVLIDHDKKAARLRRKGQKVTLGGIAKGYAVDRASKILRAHGFADFVVQDGGDMFVAGRKGPRAWRVGIQDPRAEHGVYFAAAEIQDRTFSTSGDYERFVIKDGKRYHHIIDPTTGFPATRCRAVTIMALDAFTAEGLSKTVFIWGPERGAALLEKLGVDGVIVGADNKVTITKGLKDKVWILQPPSDGT
jgi:thiamine biosynthesis lipoprotein